MTDIYQRIDGSAYRNIWVMGDLHGCHTLLMSKLDEVGFDTTQDLLISVGDLIDRGTENVECMELLTFPWFRAVRGNHENLGIRSVKDERHATNWLHNGGGWFYSLWPDQQDYARKLLLNHADKLPYVIELNTDDKKVVICHADWPFDEYEYGMEFNSRQLNDITWNRERITASQNGLEKNISGANLFIFGHTPAKNLIGFSNQIYIDTGAVFCGNLTLRQLQGVA